MKILVAPCLVTAALSLATFPALAVEPLDTFCVRLGGYVQTIDTELLADGQTAACTEIDLERDLGIDEDTTIGYASVSWRPWDHHEFGLAYYTTDGDVTR